MSDTNCTKLQELLSEIRTPDSQLTTTIRIAYDSGLENEFLNSLQGFVLDYEENLKILCSNNYKSLVNSMDDVTHFNNTFQDLKSELSFIDSEVYDTASELQRDIDLITKLKNAKCNIAITLEFMSKCLPALETFVSLSNEIEQNVRKSLDYIRYLEHELLPSVQNFRFIQKIAACLPSMKQKIKETARKDLLIFLQKAREQEEQIGQITINNVMVNMGKLPDCELDITVGASDYLDFTLLRRYMLVIEELGVNNKEDQYYRSERSSQAKLLYDWQKPTNEDTFKAFKCYIHQVTGFFVIEAYITNTIQNSFSKCQLNEIFNKCSNRLLYQLEMFCKLKSSTEVMSLRSLIGHFQYVMQNCDLSASVTKECDNILKNQYNDLMCENSLQLLKKISDPEILKPLLVNNKEEEDQIFCRIPVPSNMKQMPFPKQFPFSIYVPTVYEEIFKFIELSSKYSNEDVGLDVDLESEMKITAKYFLMNVVRRDLVKLYKKCKSLVQFINAYFDAYFLDSYLPYLDFKICSLAKSGGNKSGQITIKDEAVFKSVQTDIEQAILMFILTQIDPCISSLISQTVVEGKERSSHISEKIDSLLKFLHGAIELLERLGTATLGNIFIQICKHVNSSTLDHLCGQSQPLNKVIFDHIFDDIMCIINFLLETNIANIEYSTKELFTRELCQTLNLVKKDDWHNYFAQFNSTQSDYDFVQPATLIRIYTRICTHLNSKQENKNVFQRFFKSDKTVDLKPTDILEKLRTLV